MKNIEQKLEALPDIEFSNEFSTRLHNQIKEIAGKKNYKWFNVNYFFSITIIFFVSSIGLSINMLKNIEPEKTIVIKLSLRQQVMVQEFRSNIFIYDENNYEKDVVAVYKIEDEQLKIKLKEGKYKIVVASTEYENLTTSVDVDI